MRFASVSGALALSMAVSGAAFAADMPMASPPPPPPPPVVDPITAILSPVGTVIDGVTQPIITPITAILSPAPPPPPPPAPAPVHHRRHRHHQPT